MGPTSRVRQPISEQLKRHFNIVASVSTSPEIIGSVSAAFLAYNMATKGKEKSLQYTLSKRLGKSCAAVLSFAQK